MRLALWQGHSPLGNEATALALIEQATRAAGMMGAAAVVLPEVFLPGYNHSEISLRALPRTAPVFDRIAAICRAAQCGVVLGYSEREAETIFNAAMAFDADGQVKAHYRKIQLFGPREKALYAPGCHYTIFDLHGHKTALLICYDIEFAPHVAALAEQGVTVVLVPTANMEPFAHVVRHTVPTMAGNYGVTVVYANYCGSEAELCYVGGSLIAGPHGEVLAQAGQVPALLCVDIPSFDPKRLSTQSADYHKAAAVDCVL